MPPPEAVAHLEPELNLLAAWHESHGRDNVRAGIASIAVHLLVAIAAVSLPSVNPQAPEPAHVVQRVTPLIAPRELTQTAPNRGTPSKEFDLEGLLERPKIHSPAPTAPSPRPGFRSPESRTRPPGPAKLEEPPQIAQQLQQSAAPLPGMAVQAPPPEIQTQEKPRLAFEPVGTPLGTGRSPSGLGRITTPRASVDEAIRAAARPSRAGGQIVGDLGAGGGAIGEGMTLPPSLPKAASSLELLSDPLGIDFRPYLIQVLAAVRRNWFSVIPETAHFGRRGRVQIQFSISRDGKVPKLVIALPSGTDSLDRAAVAGISASNPFPPLPAAFQGEQIRLQLTFLYNLSN